MLMLNSRYTESTTRTASSKVEGLAITDFAPSKPARAVTFGSLEPEKTTIGNFWNSGLVHVYSSTLSPLSPGMVMSSRTRSGHEAKFVFSKRCKYEIAPRAELIKCHEIGTFAS